jgi:8-hydroxy-5-deazaflavin:NADPH oxidoreductase
MQFGIIGGGVIGRALAHHIVKAGYHVTVANSRGPSTLTTLVAELGTLASAGTVVQAAAADVVFLAVGFSDVPAALDGLPNWDGRILVDATNQFELVDGRPAPVDLGDQTGSEVIAAQAPGARVIKAFNTLYAAYIEPDPRHEAGRQVVFYAGDDADAKTTFAAILDQFGFSPVDVGRLRDGGRLMQVDGGPLSALHVLKQD